MFHNTPKLSPTLNQLSRGKNPRRKKYHFNISRMLFGRPYLRATCLRVYTVKPKKPNSAIRKVAKVKFSTGYKRIVYIPGQGHNLHEHSVILVRGGRVPDLPGIHYQAMRGKYDFTAKEIFERMQRRSKYGHEKPKKVSNEKKKNLSG
jgi:small subunit ribosomal protein S12